jgi:hypothetical protein
MKQLVYSLVDHAHCVAVVEAEAEAEVEVDLVDGEGA